MDYELKSGNDTPPEIEDVAKVVISNMLQTNFKLLYLEEKHRMFENSLLYVCIIGNQ